MCVLDQISAALSNLLQNKPIGALELPQEYAEIQQQLQRLQEMQTQLQEFAVQLTQGNLEAPPPPRSNYMASGLKGLQAQIRHLTWQAQCVAEGDYSQQVDFMGEFSAAFNRMVEQLGEREAKIVGQQKLMMQLFDKLDPILVTTAGSGEHLYANHAARKLLYRGNTPDENNAFLQQVKAIPEDEEEREIKEETTGRWYSVSVARVPWSGEASALLIYCLDITMHKERESNLETAANTDQLTNLGNRRAMEAALESSWTLCASSGKPLSVLLFDIDHFKMYNDTYGHLQGDVCLAHAGSILARHAARKDDLTARYGGEEFVVVLPFTGAESALRIAENIRKDIEEMQVPLEKPDGSRETTQITISGGVSCVVPEQAYAPKQLLDTADLALYAAKRGGRNRISYRKIQQGNA